MIRRNSAVVCAGFLCVSLFAAAVQAATVEREFRYSSDRIHVNAAQGTVDVDLPGATREFRPGRPDLPLVTERVDLPDGMRVTGVRVIELVTAPLGPRVKLASSMVVKPGLGAIARTPPDAQFFSRPGMQPEIPVSLGYQGFQRGQHVALLAVAPVRWNAGTGALEHITRLRVSLTLEPSTEVALRRERIVPEWEDDRLLTAPGRVMPPASLGMRANAVGRIQKPVFAATQLPSLLGSPVAYVIVTSDSMAAQFQRLADWKTQTGVPAVVRTMTTIRQQYPYASDDADRVRQFVRDAYTRWGTKWLLLGGDVDAVPSRTAYTTFYEPGGENIPTDMYYSCLDGNWNADGDSLYGEGYLDATDPGDAADMLPEVYVGRAPVTTSADAKLFVDKTLQYEKTPVGDYENTVLYFAQVLFPENWTPGQFVSLDGAALAEETLPYLRAHGGIHYARLYQNYTDSTWEPGSLPENRTSVLDSLDRGYNMAVHIGHGYRNVMAVGYQQNLVNADALALTNGNRLINLYSINCTSNAIDFPSIGEAFLLAANGGAVTNVGSTRLDFPSAGRSYQKEYFKKVFQDSVTAVGEAAADQKLPFVTYSTSDNVNRWMEFTLILLGDPELRMFTAKPRTLTVTNPASIPISDSTLTVNVKVAGVALKGARVTAYKVNDEYRIGTTDAAGNVVLPFRPDTAGTVTLTVNAYDARPYQVQVPIVAGAQPVMAEGSPVIDDDNLGGTSGNANGLVDAGEVVDLKVQIRNNGSATASGVTGTLSSSDPYVTVIQPTVSYGTVAAGATSAVSVAYRINVPLTTPDDREVSFNLRLADGAGRTWNERISVVSHAPSIRHYSETVIDTGINPNGRPDPGETVQYLVKLRNVGTGVAQSVTAKLRSWNGLASVTDSTATWGTINPGEEKQGDAMVFIPTSTNAILQLLVSDAHGLVFSKLLDLHQPPSPVDLSGLGSTSSIPLTWGHSAVPDLLGYNVYRSASAAGPFTRLTPIPTERTSYYVDASLATLTRYYYQVTAVDSSGNESDRSPVVSVSTNPPYHTNFPFPIPAASNSPVAVDHVWPGYPLSIVTGTGDVIYAWNPDGSAPVDADGSGATSGDFTTRGHNYVAPVSIGDLDGDGSKEIVASSWDSLRTYVFNKNGQVEPGWPVATAQPVWSAAAIADLDNDGKKEIVFGSNYYYVYAFHSDGTEVRDGDANPATVGVFKSMPVPWNFATPSIADIDGDGRKEVILAAPNGTVFALRSDGTTPAGWPVNLGSTGGVNITGSSAIGSLDGTSELSIVIPMQRDPSGADSMYVLRPNGQRKPGWPQPISCGGMSLAPSPALADMNNDGKLDVVYAGTDGRLYVYSGNGVPIAPLNGVRFSTIVRSSEGGATTCSPVVADINGDGLNDVVIGDELGFLTAISGDGTVLPGFPIHLGAEIQGSPALCDLDGDGLTEIVFSGMDQQVHVWDYDFPFSPNGPAPWPQFHHDAARTGFAGSPIFTGVGDPPVTQVRTVEFAAPTPNPAPSATRIAWAVPADRVGSPLDISIYDLSGRRILDLVHGTATAGRYSRTWDLRDEHGARVQAGVFFVKMALGGEAHTHKLVILN